VAALLAAGLALTACSPAGSHRGTTNGGGFNGTYVVARTADMLQLDPYKATAFADDETLGLVYSGLVTTDASGTIIPDLATAWHTSADGRTVTFTLRTGVTWDDGDAFTAADVKASIQRILDPKTGAVASSNLAVISGVDTPDDHTVVLRLSRPDASLLYALASVNAAILHAKDITANTIGQRPDGTGPFVWQKWQQGQQVTLTANPTYYGGEPRIHTLEFRVIPSESSILSGMRAGAFQLGLLSDPAVANQAGGLRGVKLLKEPDLAYHALMLNGRKGPLTNQRVRQAIACAIDPKQVLRTAAYGDGIVTGPITSPMYQYSTTAGLPCSPGDVGAAKRLLASAGYAKGFSLTTIVMTDQYATAVAEAQNIQAQLAKIGVTLKLDELTTAPYVKAWLAGDYDAAVALNGGDYDPYLMYGRYFTAGGSLATPAGLTSSTLGKLLDEGNATSNETTRHTVFGELQRQLLVESPWVWTFRGDDFYLENTSAPAFTPRADGSLVSLADH
jgi:peptide/nickel transport system substrate-binding protein